MVYIVSGWEIWNAKCQLRAKAMEWLTAQRSALEVSYTIVYVYISRYKHSYKGDNVAMYDGRRPRVRGVL